QSAFALWIGLDIGSLKALDHVVAEEEGVCESLERESVLRPGNHLFVGHGSESQDQLVVGQFAALPRYGHVDDPPLQIDALNGGLVEGGGSQECTEGKGAMAKVKSSRTRLKQQRRHEKEVIAAHQPNLDLRPALAESFQVARGVNPTEA